MQNFIWFFKILRRQWSWYNDRLSLAFHLVVSLIIGLISLKVNFPFLTLSAVYFCAFTIFHHCCKLIAFSLYILFLLYTKKDYVNARQSITEMYNWRQSEKNKHVIYVSSEGVISHGRN